MGQYTLDPSVAGIISELKGRLAALEALQTASSPRINGTVTVAQALTANVDLTVPFDTRSRSTVALGDWNLAGTRITFSNSGLWAVSLVISFGTTGNSGSRAIKVVRNGSEILTAANVNAVSSSSDALLSASWIGIVQAADFLEVSANSGAAGTNASATATKIGLVNLSSGTGSL